MTGKTPVLAEMKANIERACAQIARLTAIALKLGAERDALAKERDALAKERDALADDNVNLQIETMEWQDEWYKMKMALKNSRKQMIYPKRSQRIKDRLKGKSKK